MDGGDEDSAADGMACSPAAAVPSAAALRHPEKAHRPDQPVQARKPAWIRVKAPTSQGYKDTRDILRENRLSTVCEEAGCPNIGECWSQKHATLMIMGDTCTRACAFCNVRTGLPEALDADEPLKIADSVAKLKDGADEIQHAAVEVLKGLDDFSADAIQAALRARLCDDMGVKPRLAFAPVRVAVTGSRVSPPLFEAMEILGKESTLRRMQRFEAEIEWQ